MVERHQSIENIKVEVQNMASISKEILFHASKFLEIMVFQLIFEIKWIQQVQLRRQTVPNNWCQIGQTFLTRIHVFNRCFSFKTNLIFAWFWPNCIDISWKYRAQVSLKNFEILTGSQLIFSMPIIPMWLLLFSWRQYLIHVLNSLQFVFKFLIQIWTPSWSGIIKMWLN